MKKSASKAQYEDARKTSLVLPKDLHRRRGSGLPEDGSDFRSVVIAALEAYLRKR